MILIWYLWIDSGIVQQIRERTNNDGTSEYEYYIHYIDCNLNSFWCKLLDDKRMEGWVPSSRIAPLNKKNIKRLREVDNIYVEKVELQWIYHS